MAERKFDYAQVAQNYKNMTAITGDAATADSIAGIFDSINKEYEANVDVSEMAIYGDLGKQLLLDWKNTASNFPSFVDKFSSWSTVVVQSANDYSKFETEVKGFRDANPLGFASGGITQNHIESSTLNRYADANIEQHNQDVANLAALHTITPGEYERSDAQKALSIHKGVAGVTCAVDLAALAFLGAGSIISPAPPALPGPGSVPALPGASSTALSVVDDAFAAATRLSGHTATAAAANGGTITSTITKVGDNFILKLAGSNGQLVEGPIEAVIYGLRQTVPALQNQSVNAILRNLGFLI